MPFKAPVHGAAERKARAVNYERERNAEASRKWYGCDEWQSMRRQALVRDGYQCRQCGELVGHRPKDAHADHIIAHNGSFELFFDINNVQTLCSQCHGRKTRSEETGGGFDL